MRYCSVVLLSGLLFMACSSPPPSTSAAGNESVVTGTVKERLDSPPYTYLRLHTSQGETWVAVPLANVAKEETVTILNAVQVRNMKADAAGRRFDVVSFGTLGPRSVGSAGSK